MTKWIRVSDQYHELLKAHNRAGETMEETLRRVAGGPDSRVLAGILNEGDAARMAEAMEHLRGRDQDSRQWLQTVLEDVDVGE